MEHFPELLTREQSDALIGRIEAGFGKHGFGLWAVELRESGEFVGFAGLAVPEFEAHFTPAVEVGWRLAYSAWGNGYATEAGRAALGEHPALPQGHPQRPHVLYRIIAPE